MKTFIKFIKEETEDPELKFEKELNKILSGKFNVKSFSHPEVDIAQGGKRGLIIQTDYGKFELKISDRS